MTVITKDTPVTVTLPLGDWDEIYTALNDGYDRLEELSYRVGEQLPDKTPGGLGAVVRALILETKTPAVLVLCSDLGKTYHLAWREPHEGDWYDVDAFEITEVLSQGIPWPT